MPLQRTVPGVQITVVCVSSVLLVMIGLFTLPKYVLLQVCGDFLLVSDICDLDSSLCNKKDRPKLLSYFTSSDISFPGSSSEIVSKRFIQWLSLKNIHVDRLNISNSTSSYYADFQNLSDSFMRQLKEIVMINEVKQVDNLLYLVTTRCVSLEKLKMHNNSGNINFTKIFSTFVVNCPSVIELDLSDCTKLSSNAIYCALSGFVRLTTLNISGFYSSLYLTLKRDIALTTFYAERCIGITDHFMTSILRHTPLLTCLHISNCKYLTDATLLCIGQHCHQLVSLRCKNNFQRSMSGLGLMGIVEGCRLLTSLNIYHSYAVTDSWLMKASPVLSHSLTELDIGAQSDSRLVTSLGVWSLAEHCHKLTTLNISNLSVLSSVAFSGLALHSTALTSLDMSGCGLLSDANLIAISSGCTRLSQLNVSRCDQITDAAVMAVASFCRDMRALRMASCGNVTDYAVVDLAIKSVYLKVLDLTECKKITSVSMLCLAKNAASLRELHVRSAAVTIEVLTELSVGCPALRILNCASGCVTANQSAIQQFQYARPEVLFMYT